jgi:PAS domain S-box-containing protein
MVVMLLTTSYVARLNVALRGEITTRKRAEDILTQSIERFEHIVACSGEWIWETDNEGRFTYSSSIVQDMLGYGPDEILGRTQQDFLTAAEKERVEPRAKETFARKDRLFRERYRLVTKDGRVVIHESTAEPVVDDRGELRGYRGVNRDVTSQVRFIRL